MNISKLFIAITLAANFAMADCNFATGITKVEGGYLYTKECHIKVGEMKQDLDIAEAQKKKYAEAILFKDIAITKSDERAELWRTTSFKLEDRLTAMDELRKNNATLYFGLGILTMFAAGYMASQLKN